MFVGKFKLKSVSTKIISTPFNVPNHFRMFSFIEECPKRFFLKNFFVYKTFVMLRHRLIRTKHMERREAHISASNKNRHRLLDLIQSEKNF